MKSRRALFACLVCLAVGAVLRLAWITHGLPEVVWVDGFKFVSGAVNTLATGDHTPFEFQYPPLYQNLLWLIYVLVDADTAYIQLLLARLVIALAGISTVGATFWLARVTGGSVGAATLAALLTATSIVSVTYARIPATDAMLSLFVTLAIAATWAENVRGRGILAGIALGLAIACKWTGLIAVPLVAGAALVVHGTKNTRALLRQISASYSVAALTFAAVCPQVFFYAPMYFERAVTEFQLQSAGQIGRLHNGWFDYLFSATPTWESPWLGTSLLGTDGPVLLAALAVAIFALFYLKTDWRRVFLAAMVLAYMFLISSPGNIKAVRFLMPVLPALYVFIAVTLADLARRFHIRPVIAGAIAVLLLLVPAWRTIQFLDAHRAPPTQLLAAEWFAQEIPDGSKVFMSPFFTRNLVSDRIQISSIPNAGARQYGLPPSLGPNPERSALFLPALVEHARAAGIEFFVLNSYFNDAFKPVAENQKYFPRSVQAYSKFHDKLLDNGQIVFEIKGWSEGRIGPDIIVVALDPPERPGGNH